jgi:hypothetical protein
MSAIRAATWAALLPLLPLHAAAESSCGSALSGPTRTIDGTRYIVVFQTLPQPVEVGTHFAVDFAVCPRASAEAPSAVRVDANMPAHRHGMNYRPVVTAKSSGIFRADGLLFHMPGRWDLTFDVEGGGRTERLTSTLQLD